MDQLPETHFERLDRIQMEHKHELERTKVVQAEETKRTKIRRSESRQETYQTLGITAGVVTVIVVIILAFWNPWAPSTPSGEDKETVRESQCYDNGGGWVPEGQLQQGVEGGMCVFPGKQNKVNITE